MEEDGLNLIEGMFECCVILRRTPEGDALGGYGGGWTEGGEFDAAILKDGDAAGIEGQRATLRERLTVVTPEGVALGFHDVFRRRSDGAVFRVIGDNRDVAPPGPSTVQIARVQCERWDLS